MVIVAVEIFPVGSKPPMAVSVRISTGEEHGFGALGHEMLLSCL